MAAHVSGVFNGDLSNNIKNSKLLIVGAGGIGSEILKNVVLTGFNDIEIVSTFFSDNVYICICDGSLLSII